MNGAGKNDAATPISLNSVVCLIQKLNLNSANGAAFIRQYNNINPINKSLISCHFRILFID